MQLVAVWQHGSNSNIKIVHNSIEYFLWNLSDFSFDDVLSCLIVFTNSVFQVYSPSENSQVGWDLGNRMARGYWFDVKCVFPGRSYTWGIQVFCLRNKVVPHFLNRTLEYLRHNFPWERLISRQTNNPGHPICKISTHLTIFWGGTWKTRVCENNQTREDIIRRQIRWIPLEMLNRVVDNFNVQVAAVLCVCVCVCVFVCVFVCVCVCMFILFHLLVSSGCTTSLTYMRYSDQRSFVVSILGASAKFLHLYFWIYLISPPKTKTAAIRLLERKRYDIMCADKDDIYWYRK